MKKFLIAYENASGKTVSILETDDYGIAETLVHEEMEKKFTKLRIYQAVTEFTADITINQKDL